MTRNPISDKRERIDILLNPSVIKATDSIAEMFQTSRTEIIELGLAVVFKAVIEVAGNKEIKKQ